MEIKQIGEVTGNTIDNVGVTPPINTNSPAKIFRVQVTSKPLYTDDGKVFVSFRHCDNPNTNNLLTQGKIEFTTHAYLLDSVPVPPVGSYGLVGSLFGKTVGEDLYYLGTISNSKSDNIVKKSNTLSHFSEKGGIAVDGTKPLTTINGGKNKIKVTDDNIRLGADGSGLSITGKDLSFKNADGIETLLVGDDVVITSKGNIKFVSLEGSIELVGEKVINKTPEELLENPADAIPSENNKENIADYVTGAIKIGASQYKISLTDSFLVSLNPFSGTTYEVEIMGGDSHFKLANGNFLISLLNGGFTEKKFEIVIGKLSIIKTATMKLDSKGFKIEAGAPGLFFSKYTLNLADSGIGPFVNKVVEVGYKSFLGMDIGMKAEKPMIGRSNTDIVGDTVYLGKQIPVVGKALMGRVVTTYTDPVVDYITGIMHIGSFSVFASS